MAKAVEFKVFGKVQGVFFRKCTLESAQSYNIRGFVENLEDKTVYGKAEGDEESIRKFIEFLNKGSPKSQVTKVVVNEIPFGNYASFEIHRNKKV